MLFNGSKTIEATADGVVLSPFSSTVTSASSIGTGIKVSGTGIKASVGGVRLVQVVAVVFDNGMDDTFVLSVESEAIGSINSGGDFN